MAGLAGLLALLAGTPPADAQTLTLSVAVSLKEAVAEAGRRFTATRPGVVLRFNLGASGELRQQIAAGAPVDVFISAAASLVDDLEREGLLLAGSRRDVARNALAVVQAADSPLRLAGPADLLDPRVTRIVLGNPRTVPAGRYAEESLRALGLWDRVRPRLVLAENVRQALDYVARGEVDAGFVYATDAALRAGAVRVAFRPAEATHRPIVYPAAVVAGTRQAALARALVDFLAGPAGQAALARHGFQPPAAPAP